MAETESAPLRQLANMTPVGVRVGPGVSPAVLSSRALARAAVGAAKTKLVVAVAAVVVVGAGLSIYKGLSSGPPPATPPVPASFHDERPSARSRMTTESQPAPRSVEAATPDAASLRASTGSVEPAPPLETRPEGTAEALPLPWAQGAEPVESSVFQLDLSSPEATVRSFSKAIASGDAESVMACFLPDGVDCEDMQKILNADPDDPMQQGEYQMKLWFRSLDPDAEMPMVSVEETEHGTSVVWLVTFKEDVTIQGYTFHAGETQELDATLRRAGDSWLIDGL
jgi:hypothetical protein